MKKSTLLFLCLAVGLVAGPARANPDDRGPVQADDRGPAHADDRGPAEADDRGPAQAEVALRDLDQAYVDAWKEQGPARQEAALLPLFAEDAVIMPGGGTEPKRGSSELREFWFPEGAPPTNVRSFEHVVHGVDIQDGLGVVHGRSRLEFEYDGREVVQEGNYLIVARQRRDAGWEITRMIWNNRTLP